MRTREEDRAKVAQETIGGTEGVDQDHYLLKEEKMKLIKAGKVGEKVDRSTLEIYLIV